MVQPYPAVGQVEGPPTRVRVAVHIEIPEWPPTWRVDCGGHYRQRVLDGAEFDVFRSHLPPHGFYVYVLRDRTGHPLYVGQTRHPRTRIRRHWQLQEWWPEVAAIDLTSAAGELDARELEIEAWTALQPAHSHITDADRRRVESLRAVTA